MLLPMFLIGWCYCQWLMLLPQCSRLMLLPWWLMLCPPMGEMADVVAMVAWWNSHWGQFSFNSDVVCRTSSHMWGRWYLPIFLFRDGSLTLMNKASFIALVRFWSSLPTIVKLLMVMLWPEMLQWSNIGEGAFWCSLNLSTKFLADSPMYSSVHPEERSRT